MQFTGISKECVSILIAVARLVLTLRQSNVFVDESGHACIADFGVATITKEVDSTQSTAYEPGLTPRWTAPEILNGESYTKAADVFSFAMLMIEVHHG